MGQFNLKQIIQSIGVYGFSQAVAAISAIIRLPIAIGYLGISDFGKMISLIQVLTVPLLFQGAMRFHFRKAFSKQDSNQISSFTLIQRTCLKFSIQKFKFAFLACMAISILLARKFFAGDTFLSIVLLVILCFLFFSIFPTAIHYGHLDSKGKQDLVIAIDIVSSVISVPILLLIVAAKLSISFVVCAFTLTLWMPILIIMYLSRNQNYQNSKEEIKSYEKDFRYFSYLKVTLGSSLTLNYNSVLLALQTNPILVAKINIAEKLLSTIFIPTAALAPNQFVNLTKKSQNFDKQFHRVSCEILIFNTTITLIFAIPIVIATYYLAPYLMNQNDTLSLRVILSIAFAYLLYSLYSTLQLMNSAKIESSNWSFNLGIMLGCVSFVLCFALAANTQDLTLLFSIGLVYFIGFCILFVHLFFKRVK